MPTRAHYDWGDCPLCDRRTMLLSLLEIGKDKFQVDVCKSCLDSLDDGMHAIADRANRRLGKGIPVNGNTYVIGDDGLMHKNPILAGVVDTDLVEFFICFPDGEPPEVVIERIPNYKPHRGLNSVLIWAWYQRAAETLLATLGFAPVGLVRALSGQRMFGGPDHKANRPAPALSFHFALVAPIPMKHVTKHDGSAEIPMYQPEGSFMLTIKEKDETLARSDETLVEDEEYKSLLDAEPAEAPQDAEEE